MSKILQREDNTNSFPLNQHYLPSEESGDCVCTWWGSDDVSLPKTLTFDPDILKDRTEILTYLNSMQVKRWKNFKTTGKWAAKQDVCSWC